VTGEPYPQRDEVRPGPYRRPIPANPVALVPLPVNAAAVTTGQTTVLAAPGGAAAAHLPGGAAVRILGYETASRTWLEVSAGGVRGWVPPTAVTIIARDPALLDATVVAGKGMWATYDLLDRASPEAIVETAKANNIGHIYLQVGRSNLGYYGAAGLDRLLPLAHAHGVAVVGWVYPFLKDVTADVNMTMQAARHVTPGGHRIDALAADIEENMAVEEVEGYSQIVRAMLGDNFPMVVATYAPEQWHGRNYSHAMVARYWNVIAPMDYYRGANRSFTADAAYGYVLRSIHLIRERAGRPVQVAPIGQAYGIGWPNETGPTNPSGEEKRAMLRAARDGGAIGISFYQWSHATAPQWREIANYRW